jgi:hypothetical protein
VESNPPGAIVKVGAKIVNGIVVYSSARTIGTTPVTAQLAPADITMEGQGGSFANLHVQVEKQGYIPSDNIIGLGQNGHLENGKTYLVSVTLRPLGSR